MVKFVVFGFGSSFPIHIGIDYIFFDEKEKLRKYPKMVQEKGSFFGEKQHILRFGSSSQKFCILGD